jgi:hypothetical protein
MNYRGKILAFFVVAALLISALPYLASAQTSKTQSSIVGALLATIAKHLALHPESALDLSHVSGEYCFNAKMGQGGMMLHWAIDPETTKEDVVSFYNAGPLLKAGLKEDTLTPFCGKLGCMEPNKWYFLPAGEYEPHHGVKFPFPLIIKAMDMI